MITIRATAGRALFAARDRRSASWARFPRNALSARLTSAARAGRVISAVRTTTIIIYLARASLRGGNAVWAEACRAPVDMMVIRVDKTIGFTVESNVLYLFLIVKR